MATVTITSDFEDQENKICFQFYYIMNKVAMNIYKQFFQKSKRQLYTWTSIAAEHIKAVTDFLFLGSKITADGDCSLEIRRHLLLGRKAMTNPDSILKSRDINLPTKIYIVKAMVFPVVMYRYESWIIKKAEC